TYFLNLAAHKPAGEPCSSAGPNLLPATHFKGTLKPSTAQ
ncbi:hypothetical protein FOXB_05405, partial [Fusarium oxysporum f. sp. conglutinans Fo5176]